MRERYPGIWLNSTPKKCESCGKETDDLFCTPIGSCNWRCRDCQIGLCEAVYGDDSLEFCLESHSDFPDSYPEMPIEYYNKRKLETKKHWWTRK